MPVGFQMEGLDKRTALPLSPTMALHPEIDASELGWGERKDVKLP
jgi:hypothetical protein